MRKCSMLQLGYESPVCHRGVALAVQIGVAWSAEDFRSSLVIRSTLWGPTKFPAMIELELGLSSNAHELCV
jgi:hypothetical protein